MPTTIPENIETIWHPVEKPAKTVDEQVAYSFAVNSQQRGELSLCRFLDETTCWDQAATDETSPDTPIFESMMNGKRKKAKRPSKKTGPTFDFTEFDDENSEDQTQQE